MSVSVGSAMRVVAYEQKRLEASGGRVSPLVACSVVVLLLSALTQCIPLDKHTGTVLQTTMLP